MYMLYCVLIYGYDFIPFHEKPPKQTHHAHTDARFFLPAGPRRARPSPIGLAGEGASEV